MAPGTVESQQGWVGGFVQSDISALCFAEGFGVGHHIENVINNLKAEPDCSRIAVQALDQIRLGAGGHRPHHNTGPNQRAGLVPVHVLKCCQIQ